MKWAMRLGVVGAALALAVPPAAHAGLVNDVPSCYATTGVQPRGPVYDKLAYVLLDQTVVLDTDLQRSGLNNILGMLQPGTKFVIAEFSAFSQGHYLNVLHTGVIEAPVPQDQAGDVIADRLANLQRCLPRQLVFAQRMAITTAAQILQSNTSTLGQSDIMLALKNISAAVAQDSATHKVVFVVSDGLENSSTTSFYLHNTARDIDPATEMAKARDAALMGDFGGAGVYLLGGGILPPVTSGSRAQRNGYRSARLLQHLAGFWTQYFAASNAKLVAFGEPALTLPVLY